MQKLVLILGIMFSGCSSLPTLNSPHQQPHQSSEQQKCCGCAGMEQCNKDENGNVCCKPTQCACKTAISEK